MKEDTIYRHILKDAWEITWKNRFLWILGFLAMFWGGIGAYQSFNHVFDNVSNISYLEVAAKRLSLIDLMGALTPSGLAVVVVLMLVILAIVCGLVVLATAGRGGLLWAIFRRQDRKPARIEAALKRGVHAFWPLFFVGVVSRLDIPLYFLILNPLSTGSATGPTLGLYVAAFIVLTLISIILALFGVYAAAFVILEGKTFWSAVKAGWTLFAEHWLVSLELALILYLINFVVGFLVLLGLLAIGIPFVLLGTIFMLLDVPSGLAIVLVPALLLYVAFLIIAASFLVTFQHAAWVVLFRRICEEGAVAKIVRLTARLGHILHRKIV